MTDTGSHVTLRIHLIPALPVLLLLPQGTVLPSVMDLMVMLVMLTIIIITTKIIIYSSYIGLVEYMPEILPIMHEYSFMLKLTVYYSFQITKYSHIIKLLVVLHLIELCVYIQGIII